MLEEYLGLGLGDNEDCVMHLKSDNVEITSGDEADEVTKNFLIPLKIDIKIIQNQWEVVSLSSIMFNYYITNAIK